MLEGKFIKMVNDELSKTTDFCVWGNNITEGIIKSTIEACILFLGYLKTNQKTSSIVFTDNIDGSFLFSIKSTFLNDGSESTYVLSMSFEDESEDDEDIYYFLDIPELTDFLKIYALNNYQIYYADSYPAGVTKSEDNPQIIFYIIPVIFTCIYNYVMNISFSKGYLEIKDCVIFRASQETIKVRFLAPAKQLFKSDKYIEIMNS